MPSETDLLKQELYSLRDFFYHVKLFFLHTDKEQWTREEVLEQLQKAEMEWKTPPF